MTPARAVQLQFADACDAHSPQQEAFLELGVAYATILCFTTMDFVARLVWWPEESILRATGETRETWLHRLDAARDCPDDGGGLTDDDL